MITLGIGHMQGQEAARRKRASALPQPGLELGSEPERLKRPEPADDGPAEVETLEALQRRARALHKWLRQAEALHEQMETGKVRSSKRTYLHYSLSLSLCLPNCMASACVYLHLRLTTLVHEPAGVCALSLGDISCQGCKATVLQQPGREQSKQSPGVVLVSCTESAPGGAGKVLDDAAASKLSRMAEKRAELSEVERRLREGQ